MNKLNAKVMTEIQEIDWLRLIPPVLKISSTMIFNPIKDKNPKVAIIAKSFKKQRKKALINSFGAKPNRKSVRISYLLCVIRSCKY